MRLSKEKKLNLIVEGGMKSNCVCVHARACILKGVVKLMVRYSLRCIPNTIVQML